MPSLEIDSIRFFDGRPPVRYLLKRMNPILRVERGDGGRIVPVECLVILHCQGTNLLGCLWIDRVILLGEGRHG